MNISLRDLKRNEWYVIDSYFYNGKGIRLLKYLDTEMSYDYSSAINYIFEDVSLCNNTKPVVYFLLPHFIKNITKINEKELEMYLLLYKK